MGKHVSQSKNMRRLLHENYLEDKEWKYVVAINDVAIHIFFKDFNRMGLIYYRNR